MGELFTSRTTNEEDEIFEHEPHSNQAGNSPLANLRPQRNAVPLATELRTTAAFLAAARMGTTTALFCDNGRLGSMGGTNIENWRPGEG